MTPFSPPTGTRFQLPLAEARENAVQLRSALPRRAALGTMHGKEQALSATFLDIGVSLVVPPDLDTDMFGTFTGETPRQGTMLDAARAKAIRAASLTGLSAGMASEGSYGPHPFIPFFPVGRELLVWHDLKSGLEVTEMIIDEAPCYSHRDIHRLEDAAEFLEGIGFPRQALVVSPVGAELRPVAKGIGEAIALEKAVDLAISLSPRSTARLQTDMRACFNPRRMIVIAKLGRRLATRLATSCPHCDHPGWGWVGVSGALCCSDCGCPTQMPSHDVLACVACDAREIVERSPEAKASPSFCPLCNP